LLRQRPWSARRCFEERGARLRGRTVQKTRIVNFTGAGIKDH
jgi:hypothetical protein